MRKFAVLLLFLVVTIVNAFLLFLLRNANSAKNLTFSQETLDLSGEFSVTIDTEFLKKNLEPAYE